MIADRKRKRKTRKQEWEEEDERLKAEEDKFIIEDILDKKYDQELKCHLYLVKWEGFPSKANTWEPEHSLLEDVPEMVIDFNDRLDCLLINPSFFD